MLANLFSNKFDLMELLVNFFCERGTDPFHSRQFFHAGLLHPFKTAKMRQQVAAAFLAHPFDILQLGSGARFAAPRAMATDGKTMRLVAHLLDQMQGRTICGQL